MLKSIHQPRRIFIESGREQDIEMMSEMSREDLIELVFLHMRNLYAVDGLYFLGIEERYGTSIATEIDAYVWRRMGTIEARRLKKRLNLQGNDVKSLMKALRLTSWALDIEDKEVEVLENRGLIRNTNCRVQTTRARKGLEEFPCKEVRMGFMESFAKEFNPDIEVKCIVCPPDEHPEGLWCEWEFSNEGSDD
ncbi:MAG: DUF6125 family protein [Thermoplasmata archaeon]